MNCVLLAHVSIPPAAALSTQISRPATGGVVVLVADPVRKLAPHDILLVVNVELYTVNECDTFPCT